MDGEAIQRRLLRRNRIIATGLLLTMAAVFFATGAVPQPGFWMSLLHAAGEAGVVGALADWFAVTALFRRPLGLPIPHTAIVPRNKDRFGEGLGTFLERHFLTEELLTMKLRAIDPARRLAVWATTRGHADAVAEHIMRLLPYGLNALDDEEIRAFTARALGEQLRDIDVAPLLSRGIGLMTTAGYHAVLLDRGIELGLDYLDRNAERLELAAAAGEKRRWWIPKAVDRQIAHTLLQSLRDLLHDLRDPEHNARKRLLSAVDEFARDLAESPEQRARVEEAKKHLLAHPDVQVWLASQWDRIRDATLADLVSPTSKTRHGIVTAVVSIGRSLLADPHMRERLNGLFEKATVGALPWRAELARFIAEVVHRWDEDALVERMELALGPDLQYVRMTGTLVGGLIGCMLFLLSQAFQ